MYGSRNYYNINYTRTPSGFSLVRLPSHSTVGQNSIVTQADYDYLEQTMNFQIAPYLKWRLYKNGVFFNELPNGNNDYQSFFLNLSPGNYQVSNMMCYFDQIACVETYAQPVVILSP